MKSVLTTFSLFALAVLVFGCAPNMQEKKLQAFIDEHVETVKPLAKAAALAYWEAAISGKPEDYERTSELTLEVRQIYSDRSDFEFLRDIKKSGRIRDPLLNRQLQVLYYAYLENQMDPDLLKQIVDLSTEIEKKFSTFRGTIDGRKVTDNQIKQILKSSTDSAERKKAWLASKQVGPVVASDLIRLVKLRNQAARKLGFDNYHTMSLTISEQDVKEIDGIFEELYKLTNVPYATVT